MVILWYGRTIEKTNNNHNHSSKMKNKKTHSKTNRTPAKMEVLRNQPASTGSDMWALGCIIYKLYTGIAYRTDRAHIIYTLSTHYQHTLQHTLSLHSLHPPSQPTLSTHPLHPPSPPTHANDTGRSPFLEDGSEYLTFQNIMSHADGRSELQYPDTIPWGE